MIRIFKINVLLCFLLSSISTISIAANELPGKKTEYTKEIKKSFKIASDGTVDLSNKYGNINLKTWNKNEVSIAVTIKVNARNESAANDIFDRINIGFSNSNSLVSAETQIESQKSSWWGDGDKGDFRIDYVVSMPESCNLDLANKYGDAFIAAIDGSADISIKYGNFDLEGVGKASKVYLGYGSGNIGSVKGLDADVNYSKFKVKKTDEVSLNTKYSKIYIDEATDIRSYSKYDTYDLGYIKSLRNEGKYDHYEIEGAESVRVESKYSQFEIEELSEEAKFDLRYGGFIIEDLKSGFSLVEVEGSHTNGKIYMEDKVAFRLEASCDYGSVKYPSDTNVSYENNRDSKHDVKGSRGSGGGLIKANLSYGGLKVR